MLVFTMVPTLTIRKRLGLHLPHTLLVFNISQSRAWHSFQVFSTNSLQVAMRPIRLLTLVHTTNSQASILKQNIYISSMLKMPLTIVTP